MKKFFIHKLVFLFAIAVCVCAYSCRKNTDCDVKINVIDASSNSPVSDAEVHIYPAAAPPPNTTNLKSQDQTAMTDESGVASFTFKLEAKLHVDVSPPSPYTAPPTGLIELKKGQEVSETIKVY